MGAPSNGRPDMPDDPHRPPILDDVEQSAVRALAADALGAWLDSIDGNPESTTVNDRKRETLLDGAVGAVAQFYEGRPNETIRQASVATSLVLWLDRDPHMLASVLASAVVRLVRQRRRTPVENLLAPLLDAGEGGAAARNAATSEPRDEIAERLAAILAACTHRPVTTQPAHVETPASDPRAARNGAPNPTDADQERFADAQARLDDDDYPAGPGGAAQRRADTQFTDWYDQAVLSANDDKYAQEADEDEFRQHYPEPPDGSRIEWMDRDDIGQAAVRMDGVDTPLNWGVYGQADGRTWRQLVVEYGIPADLVGVTFLTEAGQPTARAVADERDRSRSLGYVHGLRQAASWLRTMSADPDATGLDLKTMHHLIAGADAMARSASTRLNLDAPESVDASIQSLIVKLGAFVDGEHEYRYSGCHPEPSLDCVGWCEACAVLAAVPDDLMAQIRAQRNS
jgi:hypothetical protein